MPVDARPGINPITGETINRSITTNFVPVINPAGGPWRNQREAEAAWQSARLRGSNMPLSAYLQNVVPQPGEPDYRGGGGGLAPARPQVPHGSQTASTGTTQTTGLSETSSLNELPPDVRERYLAHLDEIGGLPAGFTPEEAEGLQIGEEEAAKLSRFAIDPVIGAAEGARQNLLSYTAAAGNFNPGLNATMQEIQREQGRQAAEASLRSRLAVSDVNRRATETVANARIGGEQFRAGQRANLLTAFPERKATGTGKTSGTTTSTDKTTSLPTDAYGNPVPGGVGGGGGSVLAPTAKTPKPSLFAGLAPEGGGLAPTVGDKATKKKALGGLAYAY